jgi:phosphatidyl-myo-inositol alpha-mannosyltransferase
MSRVVISCYDHEDNPHYGGGGAVVVREIARCLSSKHEVVVVSGSFRGCRRERTEPFQRIYLPTGRAGPRAGQLLFHFLVARAARRIPHDLWIESFTPPFSTSFIPLVTSRPVIALVQMLTAEDMTRRYKIPFGFVERRGLARYQRFIVLNEADSALVTRGRHDVSCTVIPNGVDLPDEPPPPGAGRHILFLGRIDVDQKGLDLLLAAVALAKPELPVLLAGAGRPAEERKLVRLIEQTGGPVARVGHVSGPAKEALLRDSAFVVLPSRYETFNLSALEAMAWGKPVVHFDLPRLRWMGHEAAIGVPAFDVESLAAAIRRLATDDAARASMGRAARETAEGHSWTDIGERYLDVVDAHLSRQRIRDGSARPPNQ